VAVQSTQVRGLLKLFGEAHEIGDPIETQVHLLRGFLRLIGGACILRIQCHDYVKGGGTDVRDGIDVGVDGDYRRVVSQYYTQASTDPVVVELVARHYEVAIDGVAVLRRADVVSDAAWYSSRYVSEVRRPARIDDGLYVGQATSATTGDGTGIHRAWGDRPFSADDCELARLFQLEVLGRFTPPSGDVAGVHLSRRERQVLASLLAGARRKEIAADLGISVHTLNDYVKSLYRRLGVSGLPELYRLMSSQRCHGAPGSRSKSA
jgi:DNA-binding CsgD family transcriptional regulator